MMNLSTGGKMHVTFFLLKQKFPKVEKLLEDFQIII